MAVDLIITQYKVLPERFSDRTFSFVDDGYYWFLHPLFQRLAQQTGQLIDLYGDARFRTEQLPLLQGIFNEARNIVQKQPDEWFVKVSSLMKSHQDDIYLQVSKTQLLDDLDQIDKLIAQALSQNEDIVCIGD
jgi:hypothetical protein